MTDKSNLQPPSRPRSFTGDADPRNKTSVITGIVILVAAALVVIFILPGKFGIKENQNGTTGEQSVEQAGTARTPSPESSILTETEKEIKVSEAKGLLKKTLKLLVDLESQGVKTWGAYKMVTSYEEAMNSLTKANSFLDNRQFDDAIKLYNQSIEQLEQLSAGRDKRLQQALIDGQTAVFRFDRASAAAHFKIALAIDSDNEEAKTGINRANVMDRVVELISKAKKGETSGNLDLARKLYGDALALDSGYQVLKDDLERVNGLILERDFKDSMSVAITSLDKKDFSKARLALNKAKRLKPDDPGIKDLEQQIDRMALSDNVQKLKDIAAEYEKKEKWQEALDTYLKILKLDANTGFARKGREKALDMIKLYSQVKNYISNPGDLQELKNLEHARNLYALAVSESDACPNLSRMAGRLNKLIKSYSRAVPVLIQSDNMTDVLVYKVGRFEKFNEQKLDLRPGQYKALGTRSGYRDVVVLFTVPPDGKDVTTVSISCEEKI
ncbi:MAG: hypothetical protein PVG39_05515 [Desulfobacteraceae bacterium]|jgi:tetratricopeptide (TPR) repeat protein